MDQYNGGYGGLWVYATGHYECPILNPCLQVVFAMWCVSLQFHTLFEPYLSIGAAWKIGKLEKAPKSNIIYPHKRINVHEPHVQSTVVKRVCELTLLLRDRNSRSVSHHQLRACVHLQRLKLNS